MFLVKPLHEYCSVKNKGKNEGKERDLYIADHISQIPVEQGNRSGLSKIVKVR